MKKYSISIAAFFPFCLLISKVAGFNPLKSITNHISARPQFPSTNPFRLSSYQKNLKDNIVNDQPVKKRKRLEEQDGARGLNPVEGKLKEKFTADHPIIERKHSPESRVPLNSLKEGDKLEGRIITVKPYGLFIDVGSKPDGLAHIKDISREYFVESLDSKFSPGQDIDVWVKFVDVKNSKLGLQLVPPIISSEKYLNPKTAISTLKIGDEISGSVVRMSNFGVFVDIGAEAEAFLHRRKMRLTRKQRSLQPWEIHPMGSNISGFIYETDVNRKRVELTTYLQHEWETSLPPRKAGRGSDGSDGEDTYDDMDEAMGGSSRADNLRALQRTLDLSLEDDDEDEDYDGEEEEEDLDVSQFDRSNRNEATTTSLRTQSLEPEPAVQVIMDDFGGRTGNVKANQRSSAAAAESESPEELDIEEIFAELSNGRSHITTKALRSWDFIMELMANGELDEDGFLELSKEAGSRQGKMNFAAFDKFVDMLLDELEMEIVDEDEGDDLTDTEEEGEDEAEQGDDDEEEDDDATIVINDFDSVSTRQNPPPAVDAKTATADISQGQGEQGLLDIDDISDTSLQLHSLSPGGQVLLQPEGEVAGAVGTVPVAGGLHDHFEAKSKTNDLLQYLFQSVGGKKKSVTLEDVLKWDLVTALTESVGLDRGRVQDMFNRSGPRKGVLDIRGFEKLLDQLTSCETEAKGKGTAGASEDGEEESSKLTEAQRLEAKEILSEIMNVGRCFDFVARGRATVGAEEVKEWEVLGRLKTVGVISDKIIDETIKKLGLKNKRIDLFQCESLLDAIQDKILLLYTEPDGSVDSKALTGLVELLENSQSDFEEVLAETVTVAPTVPVSMAAKDASDVDGEEEAEAGEGTDEEEYENEDDWEEIDLFEAFQELSEGKDFITVNRMAEWDVVKEMIEEGDLTKEDFLEVCKQAGAKKNKLNYEAFEEVLDVLSPLADDEEGEEEGEGFIDEEEGISLAGTSSSPVFRTKGFASPASSSKGFGRPVSDAAPEGNDDDDDDKELLSDVFRGLAGDKDRVSFKDLLNWDLVLDLFSEDILNEEALKQLMVDCGGTVKSLDVQSFDKLVDKLVELYKQVEEGESILDISDEDGEEGEVLDLAEIQKQRVLALDAEGGEEEEEGQYYDIDVEATFEKLAKGREYITVQDLKKWEVLVEMKNAEMIDDEGIEEIVRDAGVKGKKIDFESFENIMEALESD